MYRSKVEAMKNKTAAHMSLRDEIATCLSSLQHEIGEAKTYPTTLPLPKNLSGNPGRGTIPQGHDLLMSGIYHGNHTGTSTPLHRYTIGP